MSETDEKILHTKERAALDLEEILEKAEDAHGEGEYKMVLQYLPRDLYIVEGDQFSVGEPDKFYRFRINELSEYDYGMYTEYLRLSLQEKGMIGYPVVFDAKTRRRHPFPRDIYDIPTIRQAQTNFHLAFAVFLPGPKAPEDPGKCMKMLLDRAHAERVKMVAEPRVKKEKKAFRELPLYYKAEIFAFTPVIAVLFAIAAYWSHQMEGAESGIGQTIFLIGMCLGSMYLFFYTLISGKKKNIEENTEIREENAAQKAIYDEYIEAERLLYEKECGELSAKYGNEVQ